MHKYAPAERTALLQSRARNRIQRTGTILSVGHNERMLTVYVLLYRNRPTALFHYLTILITPRNR